MLALLAAIVWVISQVWLYLVIAGAAALVLWMLWVLSRTIRGRVPAPRIVAVETPRKAPPAHELFQQVAPVDPQVFDDPELAEAAALRCFAAWTRPLPLAPKDPSDLVSSIELRRRHIGRLVSDIAERSLTWTELPYRGTEKPGALSALTERSDPWAHSSEEFRRNSRHVSTCQRCAGAMNLPCQACGGSTHLVCTNCNGVGKAYGIASNGSRRMMNCKECGRSGMISCGSCTHGKVTCSDCAGMGRKERWLEVRERVRADVQVEPDGDQTKAFRWGSDGTPASVQEIKQDAKIIGEISSTGPVSEKDVRSLAPNAWVESHWADLRPKIGPMERIQRQGFWMLEVPSIEVTYTLSGASPTLISFEGLRMLAPPSSIDSQFARRASRLRYIRQVALVGALLLPAAYLLRGRYFWNGWLLGLTAFSAAVAFALYGFVRESTLGRTKARRWASVSVLGTFLLCGAAFAAEPSLQAAKRLIASGELSKGRTELTALGRPTDSQVQYAWADLSLAEVRTATDPATAAKQAGAIPSTFHQRLAANRRILDLASPLVSRYLSEHQTTKAKSVVDEIAPAFREVVADAESRLAVGELAARVHDQEYGDCATDQCRWRASAAALSAAHSADRTARAQAVRASLLTSLQAQPLPSAAPLVRLQTLDSTLEVANFVQSESVDSELKASASVAREHAESQRGKFALVGAEAAVVAQLLGVTAATGASTVSHVEASVGAYCAMRAGRCVGVYIVGTEKGERTLNDATHGPIATRALSRAVGTKVSLPDAPSQAGTASPVETRWRANGVPVLARWRDSHLIELRVGDVSP